MINNVLFIILLWNCEINDPFIYEVDPFLLEYMDHGIEYYYIDCGCCECLEE